MAADADDVTQLQIELLDDGLLPDEQLDPAASVDEVEEDDLPQVAAREDPPREPERLRLVALAGLELVRAKPDRSDLVPVGKPLRQHGR